MSTKTYLPDEIALVAGGTIIEDFEEVTVEKDDDDWSFSSGSNGELTRSHNPSKKGTITISIMQTNSGNDILSGYSDSKALIPVAIEDNNGTSLHAMPEGTIVNKPSKTYNKNELNAVEWIIGGNLEVNHVGGNN